MEASSKRTRQGRLALVSIIGVASVAACVAAFMWWKASAASAQVVASPEAVFVTRCNYSHTNSDDPIVHAGKPGAAHSHDFFGNRSTDHASTYESLRKYTGTTSRYYLRQCRRQIGLLDPYHELEGQERHSYPQTRPRPLLLSVGRQGGCTTSPCRIEGGPQHARDMAVRAGRVRFIVTADAVFQRYARCAYPLPRLRR